MLVSLLAYTSVRLSIEYSKAYKKSREKIYIAKRFLKSNVCDTYFRTIRQIIIVTMINILKNLVKKLEYIISGG